MVNHYGCICNTGHMCVSAPDLTGRMQRRKRNASLPLMVYSRERLGGGRYQTSSITTINHSHNQCLSPFATPNHVVSLSVASKPRKHNPILRAIRRCTWGNYFKGSAVIRTGVALGHVVWAWRGF